MTAGILGGFRKKPGVNYYLCYRSSHCIRYNFLLSREEKRKLCYFKAVDNTETEPRLCYLQTLGKEMEVEARRKEMIRERKEGKRTEPNIEVKFNDWSRERILKGTKHATSRYKKLGEPGDVFALGERRYRLTHVIRLQLQFIKTALWRSEGADSPDDFEKVWAAIYNKKGFRPFDEVYYHYFIEIRGFDREVDHV